MHKKVIVTFFLIVLFLASFNPSLQTTTISTTNTQNTDQIRMIGIGLELKSTNSNNYFSVNSSVNARAVDVLNNTRAIFNSVFVNENPNPVLLSFFTVNLFNSTVQSVAEHTITKAYNVIDPTQKVYVNPNSSYTESFNGTLAFAKINQAYQIQYQYQYSLTSNLSNSLTLTSPFNFTINASFPPYTPPTFIIWIWWSINGLIALQLLIGWYGNRKLKRKNSTS